jgi:hypothetical protein
MRALVSRHAMITGYRYGHIFINDAKRVDPPAVPPVPFRRLSLVRKIRARVPTLVMLWNGPRDPRSHSEG